MHDTFLMQNISKNVKQICIENNIKKVTYIELVVNEKSHITNDNLAEHLIDMNGEEIDINTSFNVIFDDILELTAEIRRLEGEKEGK